MVKICIQTAESPVPTYEMQRHWKQQNTVIETECSSCGESVVDVSEPLGHVWYVDSLH